MTLSALRTILIDTAVGTDIEQVVFDYSNYLNKSGKTYPIVLWDINNLKGDLVLTSSERTITFDCWCIDETTPESDVDSKHEVWDGIESKFKTYLLALTNEDDITIENLKEIEFEYFPAGLLSLEREMAVKYKLEIKIWC